MKGKIIYFKNDPPCSAERFIDTAFNEILYYEDNEKLLYAIENGLPELLLEKYRECFKSVLTKEYRSSARKPQQQKRLHEDDLKILKRMSYYKGYGKTLYSNSSPESDSSNFAAGIVARELNISWTKVRDRYRSISNNLNGFGDLISEEYFCKGRAARIEKELTEILGDNFEDKIPDNAVEEVANRMRVSKEKVQSFLKPIG